MSRNRVNSFVEQLTGFYLFRAGCFELPIDLEKLAKSLGVNEIKTEPMAAEAYVDFDCEGGYKVALRCGRSPERSRFSLAHELGHIVVHRLSGLPDSSVSRQYRACTAVSNNVDEEAIADAFAGSFLIPSWALLQFVPQSFGLRAIVRLADRAQASVATALIRATGAATQPCLAFHLRLDGLRLQSLRCLWSTSSRQVRSFSCESVLDLLNRDWLVQTLKGQASHRFIEVKNDHPLVAKVEMHRRQYFDRTFIYGLVHLGIAENSLFTTRASGHPMSTEAFTDVETIETVNQIID